MMNDEEPSMPIWVSRLILSTGWCRVIDTKLDGLRGQSAALSIEQTASLIS